MLGKDLSIPARFAVEDALNHVRELAPYRRDISDDDWLVLTQISLLLATFEFVCRSGRPPAVLEDLHEIPSDWRAWATLVCTETEVEDVAILGWAAARDHHELRGRPLVCNPSFAQSTALRGADADLLTDDGVLLDFKSTSTARVCERKDLWQLCGYALADTHDELAITAVGLSALRWRTRVVWPLHELLDRLAGAPVTVTVLRAQFARLLDELAGRRRRAR